MSRWIRFLSSLLLAGLAAPCGMTVVGAEGARELPPAEPWIVEGESLRGERQTGTDITAPKITHGPLVISAEQGRLSPDQDALTLHGSVRIADTVRVTTALDGLYRRTSRLLDLVGEVRGVGPEGNFQAGSMTWDRSSNSIVLRDRPMLTEVARVLWADRIEYDTEAEVGEAHGQVRILLLPDSTWAYGRQARYNDRTGRTMLLGEPRLHSPAVGTEPALTVWADTLVLDETAGSGEGLGSVRIRRGAMRTRSARAVFLLRENQILLYGEPVVWDSDGDIRADTMSVRVRDRAADQLQAFGHVRVRYEPREKAGEQNVVLGDTLRAVMQSGAVTEMEVQGNAVSLYLPAWSEARTGTGRNLCRARRIHIYLARGEAERVDLIRSASGTYMYPGDSAREAMESPALWDSLRASRAQRDSLRAEGDSGKVSMDRRRAGLPFLEPPEPSPLGPALEALLRSGKLSPPDSLVGPYDRLFGEQVDYEGDTIRFYVPEDRIRILGRGVLRYRGNELKSGEINYLADRHLVTAVEEPKLSDPQNTVAGVKMTYRTDEREGIVYEGKTEFDQGFYHGEKIKKLPGDELLVRSGDYTTCDHDSAPDYHFHSDRMKVIMKDKIVARPVILYLRNIPVMALPYYVFPIRKGRHSGIMMPDVEFGFSRNKGRFARNLGYYWALSDYMDARTWVDYYDVGPKIYMNGIYRYTVRYLLDGSLEGSYLREKSASSGTKVRWSMQGGHSQKLGPGAQVTMRADFTSDMTYRGDRDFGAGVDQRLNRTLKSSLEARKSWSRSSLTMKAARTEYLDEVTASGVKIQQSVPSLDFNLNSGALGRAPDAAGRGGKLAFLSSTYFGTSWAYRNAYSRRFDGRISANQAVQQNLSLSDNRSLGSFLRLRPSVNASLAGFARDRRGERYRGGASWSASASAGNTLYGSLLFPVGPLAGLRHVIEPSVSYSYRPELKRLTYRDTLGQRQARFPSVGGIGLSGSKGSSMSFSLGQRFHAKWRRGDQVVKQENLFSWSTSSSYDFLAKKPRRPLSFISNSMQFRPFSTFESGATLVHSPYTRAPQSFSVNTTLRISSTLFSRGAADSTADALQYGDFGESNLQGADLGNRRKLGSSGDAPMPWTASLSHAFSTQRGSSRPGNALNASLGLNPTAHWRFDGSLYLDLHQRQVISHSFSLYRDLHCWEFRFEHRSSGAHSEYFFRINIKQIPDVQYQRESR